MLLQVLSTDSNAAGFEQTSRKDRYALSEVLKSDGFRDNAFYQPRHWYNAYAMSSNQSEYQHGDAQLHFHGIGGDKWRGLSQTLDLLSSTPSDFSVPLERTSYTAETKAYWNRIATGYHVLQKASGRVGEPGVEAGFNRLSYAISYETDKEKVMQEAIDALKDAMGVSNGEHAI